VSGVKYVPWTLFTLAALLLVAGVAMVWSVPQSEPEAAANELSAIA
jgi:cytochrome b subunit of formate dehydrogenase